MNKLVIGLLFSFFVLSGFQDKQIWIKAKMPYNVHAGDKFTIEITINKLDLQHFAELKQKLPAGFIAVENESGAADFSFNKQVVKFTWLRLPRVPQFKISYDIMVDKNVKGAFSLPAQFTYIYKNQRGNVTLSKDRIRVYEKGEVFSYTDNEINSDLSYPPKNPNEVQCLRIKPYFSKQDKSLIVKLLVSRGAIQSAAKIEEQIPYGYTASIVDGKNASFSFENNKVEFIWKRMPQERNFEISYKLSPIRVNPEIPAINGNLIYLSGGSLQSRPIKQVESNNIKKPTEKDVNKDDVIDFFND